MRKQTFAVRPVRLNDVSALRRLFVDATAEECRRLAEDADGALVALDGVGDGGVDAVVGVAGWHRVGQVGEEAEVAVFVAGPWRGRGVGSRLVAEAERLAASSGMHVSNATILGDAAA